MNMTIPKKQRLKKLLANQKVGIPPVMRRRRRKRQAEMKIVKKLSFITAISLLTTMSMIVIQGMNRRQDDGR